MLLSLGTQTWPTESRHDIWTAGFVALPASPSNGARNCKHGLVKSGLKIFEHASSCSCLWLTPFQWFRVQRSAEPMPLLLQRFQITTCCECVDIIQSRSVPDHRCVWKCWIRCQTIHGPHDPVGLQVADPMAAPQASGWWMVVLQYETWAKIHGCV